MNRHMSVSTQLASETVPPQSFLADAFLFHGVEDWPGIDSGLVEGPNLLL
jgi:hypothetical protein